MLLLSCMVGQFASVQYPVIIIPAALQYCRFYRLYDLC